MRGGDRQAMDSRRFRLVGQGRMHDADREQAKDRQETPRTNLSEEDDEGKQGHETTVASSAPIAIRRWRRPHRPSNRQGSARSRRPLRRSLGALASPRRPQPRAQRAGPPRAGGPRARVRRHYRPLSSRPGEPTARRGISECRVDQASRPPAGASNSACGQPLPEGAATFHGDRRGGGFDLSPANLPNIGPSDRTHLLSASSE
jgi:hypothetical protein